MGLYFKDFYEEFMNFREEWLWKRKERTTKHRKLVREGKQKELI